MQKIDTTGLMAMRQDIIAQNNALQKASAAMGSGQAAAVQPGFGAAMTAAFNQINDVQHTAGDLTQDYTMGKTNDIAGVMMARQKSSLGFELTLQVRNKLLKAYQDIMSMPV
ncbi:flagellar hook-basal body complex protein FliE [Parasphingorhabdus cellanae]|uniref:Flagellar hook-basal body complex protein FliE n=1 Tax=Parasphingorhabdus cellanae TaxID=2806553 RepID=A0ABX7T4H2_9SPHN|nr:flagellar hook-basal body complex protein FliE [Parasphingorhabdus cellanae]QTD56483.1 flagellar hook-basal body complex protein FliE [Parasphingorhabdus cellanae]